MAEFLEVGVAPVDVLPWSTQRNDVTAAAVVGDKYAHVWELLANLADTRALRPNDQPMQTLLYHQVT